MIARRHCRQVQVGRQAGALHLMPMGQRHNRCRTGRATAAPCLPKLACMPAAHSLLEEAEGLLLAGKLLQHGAATRQPPAPAGSQPARQHVLLCGLAGMCGREGPLGRSLPHPRALSAALQQCTWAPATSASYSPPQRRRHRLPRLQQAQQAGQVRLQLARRQRRRLRHRLVRVRQAPARAAIGALRPVCSRAQGGAASRLSSGLQRISERSQRFLLPRCSQSKGRATLGPCAGLSSPSIESSQASCSSARPYSM